MTIRTDETDAWSMRQAAYVIGRRADAQGKRTFTARVLIKVLLRLAARWSP